jgi:hypothetical protein
LSEKDETIKKKQFPMNAQVFIPSASAFIPSFDCRPSSRFAIVQPFSNQLSATGFFEDGGKHARSFVEHSSMNFRRLRFTVDR